jgi:hypothetical protein
MALSKRLSTNNFVEKERRKIDVELSHRTKGNAQLCLMNFVTPRKNRDRE